MGSSVLSSSRAISYVATEHFKCGESKQTVGVKHKLDFEDFV